jgi:hypothetical protein
MGVETTANDSRLRNSADVFGGVARPNCNRISSLLGFPTTTETHEGTEKEQGAFFTQEEAAMKSFFTMCRIPSERASIQLVRLG